MTRKLFILGNGFDIDVNFKTRYIDYYDIWRRNYRWPFNDRSDGLGGYINNCAKTERWLDLEMALFNYAKANNGAATRMKNGFYPIDSDKQDFGILVNNLTEFIGRIPNETKIDNKSIAAQVLRTVLDSGGYSIYSFNYTYLPQIAARLFNNVSLYDDVEYDLSYTPVHGRVIDKSIILGVHSDANLIEGYDFLKKIYQSQYRTSSIIQDLVIADEIVFFGLSMGIIDYPYFRDFFTRLSTGIVLDEQKKRVTFFTYNDSSVLDIHKNLSALTGTDLMNLKNNCSLEFIRTENHAFFDKAKLETWMDCQRTVY